MPAAADVHGTAFKNGSVTCLARVQGNDASNIQQADISSGTYTIYLLDDNDADSLTAVSNHSAVSLTIASVIYDTLQTDSLWTKDSTGYNFKHVIDVSSNQAFTVAGRRYLIEYSLTPASGQVIKVRFRANVI